MTEYGGARSTDAEIIFDLCNKNVTMDYSLNEFDRIGLGHAVMDDSYEDLPFHTKIFFKLKSLYMFLFDFFIMGPSQLILRICEKIYPNFKFQYLMQRILKYSCLHNQGMVEQKKSGELFEPILTFKIARNLWFEYELDGEYQDKIKSVSLKRRFLTHYKYGKYPKQQQFGWNVIFEFNELPKSGSCILRHIGSASGGS